MKNEKEKARKLTKYFFLIFIPSFFLIITINSIGFLVELPLLWVIGWLMFACFFIAWYFIVLWKLALKYEYSSSTKSKKQKGPIKRMEVFGKYRTILYIIPPIIFVLGIKILTQLLDIPGLKIDIMIATTELIALIWAIKFLIGLKGDFEMWGWPTRLYKKYSKMFVISYLILAIVLFLLQFFI